MLQRAASNAYSWWWASHIRTKQSKWLEQNLQDMGEKVQNVLKLIEEDGDSFARRAEMYYKKRPELIHFVEESYRAYRALAERYDHISTELQNANNTIAYVFPEQVAFAMEEDEDEAPRIQKKPGEESKGNIPKVPKIPKDIKGVSRSAVAQKFQSKMSMKATNNTPLAKSGLNKDEGLQEIDRLQKQILALQTEKEFAKSSYEGGLAKYWEIEQQIREMQDRIGTLQDEFGAGTVIEDDEARTLMASAALKSCQETLALLQQKQEKSAEEAIVERRRINDAREKLTSLKNEFLHGQIDQENPQAKDESVKAAGDSKNMGQEVKNGTNEKQDLELLREKIKEHFEVDSGASLTVTELAEKIDELVNKVIGLEAAISSQTALIQRLRMETDDLQAQILTLEADKASLINGKNDLSEMLREMEGKLRGLHQLDKSVEEQKNNLQTHFTQAQCNLDHLSEKLHNVKPDEELPVTLQTEKSSSVKVESLCNNPEELQNVKILDKHEALDESQEDSDAQEGEPQSGDGHEEPQNVKLDQVSKVSDLAEKKKESPAEVRLQNLPEGQEKEQNQSNGSENVSDNKTEERGIKKHDLGTPEIASDADNPSETSHDQNMEKKIGKHGSRNTLGHMLYVGGTLDQATSQDEEPDWKQLFINGLENREKTLLTQYTTLLRNFKDVKVKLSEAKNKSSDSLFDTTVQLREMKSANAKKDEQIRYLRQKLSLLQSGLGKDNESEKSMIDSPKKEETEDIKALLMEEPETSGIEAKFRMDIDEVLEENLDFWLRFSTTIHQIQKFETEIQDLEAELLKIEEKQKHDGSSTSKYSVISDAKPLYKHLREIHTELSVWLDKSMVLKDELKSRFSSLCNIQEEITTALKESAEDDDLKFTSYQAAKFQGEILNMKQENNKVADELQAGLDNVTTLQLEVEKTLAKMNEEFKLSGSTNRQNNQLPRSESRSRVPLRSFIFGTKAKKQKNSIFSCMHPTLHRKYNGFRPHM